jgi:hypothetical protein
MVIFIPVVQGFAYRYLIQTKIFEFLQLNATKIIILVPSPSDPFYDKLKNYSNVIIEDYNLEECDNYLRKSKLHRALIYIRSAVQNESFDITTTKEIYESNLKDIISSSGNNFLLKITDLIIKICRKSLFLRKFLLALENLFYSPSMHMDYFEKYKPDTLIVSSLGTFHYDQFFMRQAKRVGARTVSIVLSWDNTTTRGAPAAYCDKVISWTNVMKDELINLNDINKSKIEVGGVAHYDYYFDKNFVWSREALFDYFCIDKNKKIILFATKSPNCYASNAFVAELIAKAISLKSLSDDMVLLIRLHPIYYRRKNSELVYQQDLNEIHEIISKYNNVVLNEPFIQTNVMNFSMPDREIKLLASIIKHSSVIVNMFSTLNIEASIFNIPIVNVAFENENSLNKNLKSRFDIDLDLRQSHNQRIVNSNGVKMVYKSSKLIESISECLMNPDKMSEGRKKIVDTEVGFYKGSAGERIAHLVLES